MCTSGYFMLFDLMHRSMNLKGIDIWLLCARVVLAFEKQARWLVLYDGIKVSSHIYTTRIFGVFVSLKV
jgi:hypothetical protein